MGLTSDSLLTLEAWYALVHKGGWISKGPDNSSAKPSRVPSSIRGEMENMVKVLSWIGVMECCKFLLYKSFLNDRGLLYFIPELGFTVCFEMYKMYTD